MHVNGCKESAAEAARYFQSGDLNAGRLALDLHFELYPGVSGQTLRQSLVEAGVGAAVEAQARRLAQVHSDAKVKFDRANGRQAKLRFIGCGWLYARRCRRLKRRLDHLADEVSYCWRVAAHYRYEPTPEEQAEQERLQLGERYLQAASAAADQGDYGRSCTQVALAKEHLNDDEIATICQEQRLCLIVIATMAAKPRHVRVGFAP